MQIRCPHCHHPIEVVDEKLLEELTCPGCGSSITLVSKDTTVAQEGTAISSTCAWDVRRLGHFELLEQVGVGGFGAVWKARDTVLDRMVALKVPRRGQLNSSEAEYFFRDARAAAQLRHPSIVSVHEVGRDGDTHFIASDFVDGANLHEWLSARKLTVREAAELVAQIAEAVQHAHERGVVHRDLKPTNILIDSAGWPHVTDFGLAKRETGEITMTVDGQILGTPAYMSPEQARGKAHEADARSDLYSLGMILFELLTGELPFRGEKRMLIVQILNDEAPSPRKLNSRVPRDLETICLKCLEKEPKKRYGTTAELAADLRRFLNGEAITARPVGQLGRGWRWCKRQPMVAGLTAAVFLTLLTGIATSTYFAWNESVQRGKAEYLAGEKGTLAGQLTTALQRQKAATAAAQQLAEKETRATADAVAARKDAEAAQQRTLEALASTTDDVVEKLIGQRQHLGPHERAYLESALQRWQSFADEFGGSSVARTLRAEGAFRVAQLRGKLGQRDQAVENLGQSISILQSLVKDHPSDTNHRHLLAKSRHNFADLLKEVGRTTEARAQYEAALELHRGLLADSPSDPEYREDLAKHHHNLAFLLWELGTDADALSHYEQAVSIQEGLSAEFPAKADYRFLSSGSHNNLGLLLAKAGRLTDARYHYERAIAAIDAARDAFPKAPDVLRQAAKCHLNLAALLKSLGEATGAQREYETAVAINQMLADDLPSIPDYREGLATSRAALGLFQAQLGRFVEAEQLLQQAVELQEELAAELPSVPEYRVSAAANRLALGRMFAQMGQPDEAEAQYVLALRAQEQLADAFPANPEYHRAVGMSHNNLGLLQSETSREAEAKAHFERAAAVIEGLVAGNTGRPDLRQDLARIYNNLARLLDQMSELRESHDSYERSLAMYQDLADEYPAVPEYRADLATCHGNLAVLLSNMGQPSEAQSHSRRALAIQEQLITEHPTVPEYRYTCAASHNNLGNLLLREGRHDDAQSEYEAALTIQAALAAEFSEVPSYQVLLGGGYCNLGLVVRDNEMPESSLAWFDRAITALSTVVQNEPSNANARSFLCNSYWNRALAYELIGRYSDAAVDWGRVLEFCPPEQQYTGRFRRAMSRVRAGQVAEAVAEVDQLTTVDHLSANNAYDGACVYAIAGDQSEKKRQVHHGRAVELLGQAIRLGYVDVDRIKQNSDLNGLHDREDFKALVTELEKSR